MTDPATESLKAATTNISEEISEVLEDRLIDAEYKIWKKNTPYLYDLVMTHSLEWPSLTCQWLPHVKNSGSSSKSSNTGSATTEEHSLLLGTHTSPGEMNYLMVASISLPKMSSNMVLDGDTDNANVASKPMSSYDDEKNEIGGFGFSPSGGANASGGVSGGGSQERTGRVDIKMKIPHKGEVNRARYMPQNHFHVATRGPDPEIYVWDLTKHESFSVETNFTPQITLKGHEKEGYGMSWNPHVQGNLISGGEDKTLCLWDVFAETPLLGKATGHTAVVEDVAWHAHDGNLVASVSDDLSIRLWDIRQFDGTNKAQVHLVENAHTSDINSIAFNPVNEFLFATGSADKTVALWDVRNLKTKVQSLEGHSDQVYQVEWAPFNETILASSSADRRVCLWDLSRIGEEQTAEDAEDGPPELLFMHGGHTSTVSDFSWNPNLEWVVASVSEDNILQVWNIAEEIYAGDDDDEEEEKMDEDEGNAKKKSRMEEDEDDLE